MITVINMYFLYFQRTKITNRNFTKTRAEMAGYVSKLGEMDEQTIQKGKVIKMVAMVTITFSF